MGLHTASSNRTPGLASLLDSPRECSNRLTPNDVFKLESALQPAVEYVVGGSGGAGDCGSETHYVAQLPPLVRDGHIDYAAVEQRVQWELQAAAGLTATAQPLEEAAETEPAAEPAAQQSTGTSGSSRSDGGGGAGEERINVPSDSLNGEGSRGSSPTSSQLADQPPLLEPASPTAQPPAPAPTQTPASGSTSSAGRLGPAVVSLVEARGTCEIRGCCVMGRANFSTVRSNACVFKGRWMYEVQLGSAGIMQLGWTTLQARFNSEEGVGDNHDSYAYDGRRKMRWHVANVAYGEHWTAGDIISCCIDLDAGTMRFFRNGKDLGEAFTNVRRGMPGMAYFAGISLSHAESCEVNFGGRPFLHPVEGYHPLQQKPVQAVPYLVLPETEQSLAEQRRAQLAAARYLAGCLSRLVDVSSPAPAAAAAAGETNGKVAAAIQQAADPGSELDSAHSTQEEAPVDVGTAEVLPGRELLPAAAASTRPTVTGRLLPDADMIAALAAAAASESGSSKAATATAGDNTAADGASSDSPGEVTRREPGPAIRIDDRVLLGGVLAQYLGPLCFDPYVVEAVLLPLLDDTAGELAGGSTSSSSGSQGDNSGGAISSDQTGGDGGATGSSQAGSGRTGEPQTDASQPHLSEATNSTETPDVGAAIAPATDTSGGAGSSSGAAAPPQSGDIANPCEGQELGRQRLQQLLELLVAVLEPEEISALVTTCCQVLGRRVHGSLWCLRDMPASAALSALRLWGAILECADLRAAWLTSSEWQEQLEQLLAVRQPSEDDLTELLQNLKVTWGEGGSAVVRNRREDQSAFAKDLGRLGEGLEQVEAAQADVLLQLWLEPYSGDSGSSGSRGSGSGTCSVAREGAGAEAGVQEGEREEAGEDKQGPPARGHYLRLFLTHLIDKNHAAARHIPPPGLSDQTALVAAAFGLLRLMNEQVSAALPDVPTLHWDPKTTFLQGPPLNGAADPYWDAGRMGGTLSHLAREHLPSEEDRSQLEGLPIGALVRYDAPLHLREHALDGPSYSDVWLRDRLLMLCHLSVAPLMRGALTHLASMQAAMAGLRAVTSTEAEGGGGRMLDQTRRECQQEFVRSLRLHEWAQCWLLSPWRQQAAFVLSVATAQLVAAVSAQRPNLLRYVPEFYISAPLDMVHAIHRCEPPVLDHDSMLGLGLRHVVELVVTHLDDERIVSPEVQSRLMHMVLEAVQELDLLRELGSNPMARCRLLPALMRLFGRQSLWGQASNFFALLVEGCGFMHPPPAFPTEFQAPVAGLRSMLRETCLQDPELCASFLHHLFDHTNRMLTELVAMLESAESALRRSGQASGQLVRLLASTSDYALVLLRTLELMAVHIPELFLQGSDMNLTRLAEVLGFAVPQLVSGRAHRSLARIASNSSVAQQLRLRSRHLLQPLAGLLVALWEAQEERGQPAKQQQQQQLLPVHQHAQQQTVAQPQGTQQEKEQEDGQRYQKEKEEQQQGSAAGASSTAAHSTETAVDSGSSRGSVSTDGQAASASQQGPDGQQEDAQRAQQLQQERRRRQRVLRALGRQAALTEGVLRGLLQAELSEMEPLSAEAAAAVGGERSELAADQQRRRERDMQRLKDVVSAILAAIHEAAAAPAAVSAASEGGGTASESCEGGGVASGGSAAELAEPPEEFLDPILATLMQDPVCLPDSHITLDRATIERHLLSSATDPFSRAPLTKDQLIPNHDLRQQIEAWLQQHPNRRNSLHG